MRKWNEWLRKIWATKEKDLRNWDMISAIEKGYDQLKKRYRKLRKNSSEKWDLMSATEKWYEQKRKRYEQTKK